MQGYGENVELYKRYANGMLGHNGLDISTFYGDKLFASFDGVVVEMINNGTTGYGNEVKLMSDDLGGFRYNAVYGHMTENIPVKVGDRVKAGDVIGYEGNSGFVVSGGVAYWGMSNPDKRGTHLHFGVRVLLPATTQSNTAYLGVDYIIKDYGNGRYGYIDPLPLLESEDMLTQEQVDLFYDIEALPKDDSGRTYWVGKPVEEMLKTRKNDLKSFLNS